MIGRRLSHYQVVAPLGSGGMGTVYRAEDTLLGRPVALKFPRPDLVAEPAVRERFLREARAASALDHPNIVVLYDICDVEGELFLAMQCVEGSTLRVRLQSGPLPWREAAAVGRAVSDALAHAHGRGVVHRDIKPENVLMDSSGRVKVTDFGVARVLGESRITGTGGLVGTSGYLAPEILAGGSGDARSDLFALGALLHELCTARPAFGGEHDAAVAYQVVHGEPQPLPDHVPAALSALIRSLLEKAPERRPTSAEVADALGRLGSGEPAIAPATDAPPRSIAVLYFENLTGGAEDDYFCAGITEDLLTEVLKIPDLNVASRTAVQSLRGRHLDVREARQKLAVATLLEGGVRRSGQRVRVTARLVRTDNGYQMWAERYDRNLEDIFEVQEDIARQIASALRVAFEPEEAEARLGRRTANPKAYDLRLQAMAEHRRYEAPAMRRAIELFDAALREDPAYALARADLAESCVQMVCKKWDTDAAWLERAEREVRQALQQSPALPEGHRALGHILMHRHHVERALRSFQAAVELDPRFTDGVLKLGNAYMFLGDHGRSEIYLRRALDLDPDDPRIHVALANLKLRQRRLEEARSAAEHALTLTRSRELRLLMYNDLLLSYGRENRDDDVGRIADRVRQEFGTDDSSAQTLMALAAAFMGRAAEARALLARTDAATIEDTDVLVSRARLHALLGEREAALEMLARAVTLDLVDFDELRGEPLFAGFADDPRYVRLVEPTSPGGG